MAGRLPGMNGNSVESGVSLGAEANTGKNNTEHQELAAADMELSDEVRG